MFFSYFYLKTLTNTIRINRNGSLVVEPNEWKEYFFLASLDNMDEMLCHWHSAVKLNCSPNTFIHPFHLVCSVTFTKHVFVVTQLRIVVDHGVGRWKHSAR